jgi:hypothetical protein
MERAAMANQETSIALNTTCIGIDTGARNSIVAVVP